MRRHHGATGTTARSGTGLRLLAVAMLAALAGALVPVSAATAAVEPRDRVYASYLPTVEQLTPIYPFLEGGSREVGRYRGLGAEFSCWDWTQAFLAADGRWSYYLLKSGAMPYFRGYEDPAVFVFKFHTRRDAMGAYWQQQRFVHDCMGRQITEGTVARLWEQRVPFMGWGSIAYRVLERNETVSGSVETRQLHIAVVRGRYLVNVFNQARAFQPSTDNGVRLMRITLANIG